MSGEREKTAETLDYIGTMLGQLQAMSREHGQDMLAYLIDMAQIEAREQLALTQQASVRKQRDSAA